MIKKKNKSQAVNKIARNFVKILYATAIIFTTTNLGGSFLGISPLLFQAVFVFSVTFFFFFFFKENLDKKVGFFLLVFTPLVIANCVYSIEVFNTSVYWILWLMFFIATHKMISLFTQKDFEYVLSHVPYVLFCSSVILMLILLPHLSYSFTTRNSLGLLAGATLVASLAVKKKHHQLVMVAISFFILSMSDSRSSLVFALLVALLYISLRVSRRNFLLYLLGGIILVLSSQSIYNYLEQKMLKKELYATNLQEALTSAQGERTDLLKMGWELFKERPYIGFGLKSKYYEGRISLIGGESVHVHNGYLGTLIETGIVISFFILIGLIRLIFEVLRGLFFHKHSKNDNIWFFFLLFGLIRAYGENYLFFNIGNIFSIIFLFLSIVLLFGSKLNLSVSK